MGKPKTKRKRETATPKKDEQPVLDEPSTEKFSPQLKLDFTKAFSPKQVTFSAKSAVDNLDVRVLVAGTHVLVIIPGFSQTGWVDNLNVGIALCKTLDMRGFKLPEDITVDANRFAYYNCFEDAQATAKRLFDPATKDVVPAGIKVGKTDPTSDPPKVHFGGTRCPSGCIGHLGRRLSPSRAGRYRSITLDCRSLTLPASAT
jgi:hypothetical protein